jgi:transcriptional regulator with XRE-family HTH domain
MSSSTESLASSVRSRRESLDLSLRRVAARIGITHSALYRIEHGLPVESTTLLKVQAWLAREAEVTTSTRAHHD